MAYDPQKLRKIEEALDVTAKLIGPTQSEANKENFIEGLNLDNDASTCLDAAQAIKDGIFKTVIMGTFNNGKSSIINALIGSKILPEAATPATAIISYIRYGKGTNKVFVHFNDGRVEEMSFHDFFNEYKFNNEDAIECKKTNKVTRFLHIDKSIVNCEMPLLENGVQILDSPGLEDKESATKITINAARNANAILYTGSFPSGGFNVHDVLYFKPNFDGRQLNNVFFIINKVDYASSADELNYVKDYFKTQLMDVFTDGNGKFNQQLYDKRVFFVSAKYALEYKTGEHSEKYSERDLPDFLKFEKELENFLTTDERSIATFTSCFSKLANAYNSAQHTADINTTAKSKDIETVNDDFKKAEKCLADSENELKNLKKSFDVATVKTQNVINTAIIQAVDDIESTWDADIKDIAEGIDFGVIDFAMMALNSISFWKSQEEKEQKFLDAIKPITSAVNNHIESKLRYAIDNFSDLTKPIITELRKDIDFAEKRISVNFDELYKIFKVEDSKISKESVNPVKLVAAALNNDVNVMVGLLAGNDMGWMDFLKKALLQVFIDAIFFAALGPFGWLAFIARELYQLFTGAGSFKTKLMNQSKEAFMKGLKQKIHEQKDEFDTMINNLYQTSFTSISQGVSDRIKDEKKTIETTRKRLNDAQFDFEAEIKRCNYIKGKIYSEASEAHSVIFNKALTLEEFAKYSTK